MDIIIFSPLLLYPHKQHFHLRHNFTEGWERGGAAFAVYYHGKLVVDLWGGYADKSCNRRWNEDTITTIFSCTKAGLPYFEPALTLADLTDGLRMATIVEQEAPKFLPGTRTAYHPLTYGWLVDQVEVRVARLTGLNPLLAVREFLYDRKIATIGRYALDPRGYFSKGLRNMRNFGKGPIKDFTLYNNPETRYAGQPAVNGVGSARGLALVHQLAMDGTLLSNELKQKIFQPLFVDEFDHSIGELQSKGYGFMFTRSPTGSWQVGHMGVGGQIVRFDPENDIVLCYLTNAFKAGSGEHVFTYNRLQRKVYEIIKK
ncbi:beta-lactamase [Necator americanus]|uniref:Beta-lactamase n=1 Tax=Necator americanus TaxID=51031 RepID=W2TP68_NECAM|nr:beta-lactamase [Necator americanus]ETN82931.1 beta-lactamase [Necator americanus]